MQALGFIIPGIMSLFGGGKSSQPSPDPTAAMQQQAQADAAKQAAQEAATKAQLIRKSAPDAQTAVGGSLTDAPFAQLTADIAGQPGDIQTALKLLSTQSGGNDTSGLSFSGGA